MPVATAKVVLDTRTKHKSGTYAVKLRLTYKREQKYIKLHINLTEEDWANLFDPKYKPLKNEREQFAKTKFTILENEKKAIDIAADMGELFSFKAFALAFSPIEEKGDQGDDSTKEKCQLEALFNKYIAELKDTGRHGNASVYQTSINSLKEFSQSLGKEHIRLSDITVEWLYSYESWFLSKSRKDNEGNERKTSISSAGFYLRSLRTILNIAIESGMLSKEDYPFGKRRYQIAASRNIKKALSAADLKKIIDYTPENAAEERARDLWLFSYLSNGANIKDVAKLRWKNVSPTSIVFTREKTKRSTRKDLKPIVVMILPELQQIIDKWSVNKVSPETYVFGLLSDSNSEEYNFKRVRQIIKTINKYTKRIGVKLGIDVNLTSGTARHSFATALKRAGVSIEYISESMGHQNVSTTDNYLASFEDNVRITNQRLLLNFDSIAE